MSDHEKPDTIHNRDEEPFDPYNFSEIERIQQEIERDLNAMITLTDEPEEAAPHKAEPNTAQETGDAAAAFETEPFETKSFETETYTTEPFPAAANETPEAFYRETIKETGAKRGRGSFRRAVAVVCIISTLGTGSLGFGIGMGIPLSQKYLLGGIPGERAGNNPQEADSLESTRYVFSDVTTAAPAEGRLSDLVKLVEPSVVSVTSVYESSVNDFLNQQRSADASGIIFAEDTQKVFIATNYHVVNGATSVNVSIAGGSPLAAKPVGREEQADLAVISVEKQDIRQAGIKTIVIASFGDSDVLEVGDAVLAIGNAMGEGNSATYGIISAKEKQIPMQNRTLTVLQTDAAINPGNSGGPLINTKGEVIGINTAKLSNYYNNVEGMGYSISSNVAKPILEELMNVTPRPFLGVQGITVSEDIAAQYSIPPIGVLVSGVIRGSGAEKAGIGRTDIITSFNGNAVFTMEQLIEEVRSCRVGETIEMKILREGKNQISLQVKLGENNSDNF